jgi:hypothetical protein
MNDFLHVCDKGDPLHHLYVRSSLLFLTSLIFDVEELALLPALGY